jgi:hypothetical protein
VEGTSESKGSCCLGGCCVVAGIERLVPKAGIDDAYQFLKEWNEQNSAGQGL